MGECKITELEECEEAECVDGEEKIQSCNLMVNCGTLSLGIPACLSQAVERGCPVIGVEWIWPK